MKLTIKLNTNDKIVQIPLGGSANLLGYDDNVGALVNGETESSINITSDSEVRRFNLLGTTDIYATFLFWDGISYISQIAPYEFSGLTSLSNEARNSFYVMQVFDTDNEAIQTKLHTGYFNGYDFLTKTYNLDSFYNVRSETTEFLSLYIPNSFTEESIGSAIDLYVKFLFYSAKSSKFYPFATVSPVTKQQDLYYKITLDKTTFKYTINGGAFTVFEILNPDYSTLINNTVSSIPVQKTVYPSGNTFIETGHYVTI